MQCAVGREKIEREKRGGKRARARARERERECKSGEVRDERCWRWWTRGK